MTTAAATLHAAPAPAEEEGYEPVEGRDLASVELERALEARAAEKFASDMAHVVWAYGILWTVVTLYVLYLYRRIVRIERDLGALERGGPPP